MFKFVRLQWFPDWGLRPWKGSQDKSEESSLDKKQERKSSFWYTNCDYFSDFSQSFFFPKEHHAYRHSEIYVARRMILDNLGDPLIFSLPPLTCWCFWIWDQPLDGLLWNLVHTLMFLGEKLLSLIFSSSTTIKPKTSKTKDIRIIIHRCLCVCLMLISQR